MIWAEAKLAEGYHAFKNGEFERAERILKEIAHKRARALLAEIKEKRTDQARRSD